MILAVAIGALAAAALVLGAGLVWWRNPSSRAVGLVMGFGAGALISSIAYELIPDSLDGGWGIAAAFALGALVFYGGDWWIDARGGANRKSPRAKTGGSGTTIFLGTLLDGLPESFILGLGIATGSAVGIAFLAAVFVSNVPEGIAGTLNLQAAGRPRRTILWMWLSVVVASAVSAALGYLVVQTFPAADGRYAQAFAACALLTMLAEAMMPEAFEHGGKAVGLLTVMGFLAAAILAGLE